MSTAALTMTMKVLVFALLAGSMGVAGRAAANPVDRNLAYKSPFENKPHLGYDTRFLHARLAKRELVDAEDFTDEHYPAWYAADFSKAEHVYTGGINFTHGVASGDPFDTSVLLWTRAVPSGTLTGAAPPDASTPVCVSFGVWAGSDLSGAPVDHGQAFTSAEVDWTVKVEAGSHGLSPDSTYYYRFADCTNNATVSVTGTTRTLPSPDTPAEQVNGGKPITFAVFSCANYPYGYFNAYAYAAEKVNADIFIHLGDYIYEYKEGDYGNGTSIGRPIPDYELATLTEYRSRIALYRGDPATLSAHQGHPWITIWDDHEVADNTWKGGSSDSNDTRPAGCEFSASGACFSDRKAAAVRAYHEWMPIRQVAADDRLRIWRNFQVGQLLDLTMLDTRHYDRDITDLYYNKLYIDSISGDADRTMMGSAQEQWLFDTLKASKARKAVWRIIGQQVVFTQLDKIGLINIDAWDGYKANRLRILECLYNNSISNTIILSGDSHANWVSDLSIPGDSAHYDKETGEGAIGVEFAGTAVSSPSPFGAGVKPVPANILSLGMVKIVPDLQWSEASYRGFFTLEVSVDAATATYYAMNDITTRNTDGFAAATFEVKSGENKLSRPVAGGSVAAGVLKSIF